MTTTTQICALTIAGLDPSGGAGIIADLRSFAATSIWGCAACAVLTVQSTAGLRSALSTPAEQLQAQIDEVLAHQRVVVIKTGALGASANVRVVLEIARKHPALPLVVDPVMIATRSPEGARLLDAEALGLMRELSARALVVTPNTDEAEALLECRIRDEQDQREAARTLVARGAFSALVKGGHLDGEEAVDILAFTDEVVALRSPRQPIEAFHGGGCHLASLIAGYLGKSGRADRAAVEQATRAAKARLDAAIATSLDVGDGLRVLPVSAG